jgi:hypothetical protein
MVLASTITRIYRVPPTHLLGENVPFSSSRTRSLSLPCPLPCLPQLTLRLTLIPPHYLAGQDPGIDCTSVMDDMFAEERGKKFTYTYRDRDGVEKMAHPQEYLPLSTSSPAALNAKS